MRFMAGAAAVAVASIGFVPSGAGAESTVVSVVRFSYSPDPMEIKVGEELTFVNLDPVSGDGHSLSHAPPKGAGLRFSSGILAPGTSGPVAGVAELEPGRYNFTCFVHPFMLGRLIVK